MNNRLQTKLKQYQDKKSLDLFIATLYGVEQAGEVPDHIQSVLNEIWVSFLNIEIKPEIFISHSTQQTTKQTVLDAATNHLISVENNIFCFFDIYSSLGWIILKFDSEDSFSQFLVGLKRKDGIFVDSQTGSTIVIHTDEYGFEIFMRQTYIPPDKQ